MASPQAVVDRINSIAEYKGRFEQAFGKPASMDTVAEAIADFERTLVSGDSPFDRWQAGDKGAMSAAAVRGLDLFQNKARCVTCHAFNPSSPFFTDFKYHNIGVGAKEVKSFDKLARAVQNLVDQHKLDAPALDRLSLSEGYSELGRFLITRQPRDIGAFKTSDLRDVELRAPYMHNGSLATLRDVVDFYNRGGEQNAYLDGGIRKLDLTEAESSDLEAFLKALTGDRARRLATGEEKL